ncbi:MAG: hypothetical protein QG629_505 [Patescibacteria group bacterium]|nr:hypothetical protein [Candidatus Saccharibacteria bacterium]MDQ5963423.1 hypothetical protein [Patescibacteria group bacterium]
MTMTEISPELQPKQFTSLPGLDHPEEQGWPARMITPLDNVESQAFKDRFMAHARTPEQIATYLEYVNHATLIDGAKRQLSQKGNMGYLSLDGPHFVEYLELAGKPKAAGEFIKFLGSVANRAFELPAPLGIRRLEQVTVEWGGVRQAGDWDKFGALKTHINGIIASAENLLEVHDYTDKVRSSPTYRLTPMSSLADEKGTVPAHIVCRRSRYADVTNSQSGTTVRLFGQGRFLVLSGELDGGVQKALPTLEQAQAEYDGNAAVFTKHSEEAWANPVVRPLERALREDRGVTTAFVPLSGQILMSVVRA